MFRVSVPSNWREMQRQSAVTFAPDGAYGQANGQNVFTHGVEIGVARNEIARPADRDRRADRVAGAGQPGAAAARQDSISVNRRRPARAADGADEQPVGDRPDGAIAVFTTQMRDGNLFYAVAVAPQNEFDAYRGVFDRVVRSIQLME